MCPATAMVSIDEARGDLCVVGIRRRRRRLGQGHGRTSDRDQPFTFERSADDVADLLRHLGVPQADVFGFSNGALVALHVAIRHLHQA